MKTLKILTEKYGASMPLADAAAQLGIAVDTLRTMADPPVTLVRTFPEKQRSPRVVNVVELAKHLDACYLASL